MGYILICIIEKSNKIGKGDCESDRSPPKILKVSNIKPPLPRHHLPHPRYRVFPILIWEQLFGQAFFHLVCWIRSPVILKRCKWAIHTLRFMVKLIINWGETKKKWKPSHFCYQPPSLPPSPPSPLPSTRHCPPSPMSNGLGATSTWWTAPFGRSATHRRILVVRDVQDTHMFRCIHRASKITSHVFPCKTKTR